MTDRSILFSGPMVNAILGGRKTQTRRVINLDAYANDLKYFECSGELREYQESRHGLEFVSKEHGLWHPETNPNGRSAWYVRIPIMTGDRLYVREAWRSLNGLDHLSPSAMGAAAIEAGYKTPWGPVKYIADGTFLDWDDWHRCDPSFGTKEGKFRQGMHMPRWASRLTLVVTDVRVQRLQEINGPDSKAEGVQSQLAELVRLGPEGSYRSNFHTLWDSINDARGFGWDANPWVVAVTFETHNCNIDQMEAVNG